MIRKEVAVAKHVWDIPQKAYNQWVKLMHHVYINGTDGWQYVSSEILSEDTSSLFQLFDRFLKVHQIAEAKITYA